MSDDEIPDPTELRRKLGILPPKPVKPRPLDRYENAVPEANSFLNKGRTTIADYEPDPRIVDEAEWQKIQEILQDCPPACAVWLKKYIVLGNKSAAASAIGYSAGTISWWKKMHPTFARLLSFYDEELRYRCNEIGERRGLEGFKEEIFNANGSLKMTRIRQDPQFTKALLQKLDPDWKDEQLGTQITINVTREEE